MSIDVREYLSEGTVLSRLEEGGSGRPISSAHVIAMRAV